MEKVENKIKRRKLTIEDMHILAAKFGGECLSEVYITLQTKLIWQCKSGHVIEKAPADIISNKKLSCKDCKKKLTLEKLNLLAQKRGGKCLSPEFNGWLIKLKWRCALGHIWEATPAKIQYGAWYHVCGIEKVAAKKRLSIQDAHILANTKNGKCLSTIYINSNTKLKWQCDLGHIWEASHASIKFGTWCPYCVGKNKIIRDMQNFAKKHGGKCLSKKYNGSHKKLKWQCERGHIWLATPTSVVSNHWCPYCVGQGKRTIKDMQILAKQNGGKCLSKKYIDSNTKLKWQCIKGHIWFTVPNNIKSGKWCPECKVGFYENFCRKYFEKLFNKKFPSCKPEWLISPKTKHKLQLDGFCKKLNIAFEHNGRHHYIDGIFAKNQLERVKYNDKIKKKLCNENNVSLFIIPELFSMTKLNDFQNLIKEQCVKNKITIPKVFNKINLYNIIKDLRQSKL